MLDFDSFGLDLAAKDNFQFVARFSANVVPSHKVAIDISITSKKHLNRKFTPTQCRPLERHPQDESNGEHLMD